MYLDNTVIYISSILSLFIHYYCVCIQIYTLIETKYIPNELHQNNIKKFRNICMYYYVDMKVYTHRPFYGHACIKAHIFIHSYILHTYRHTYIHTYIQTNIFTYIHTYIQIFLNSLKGVITLRL